MYSLVCGLPHNVIRPNDDNNNEWIWQKAASPPHTDVSIAFARRGQCAPATNIMVLWRTRVCPANSISFDPVGLRGSLCIVMLNLVKICRTAAYIWWFSFSSVRHVGFFNRNFYSPHDTVKERHHAEFAEIRADTGSLSGSVGQQYLWSIDPWSMIH